MQKRRIARYVIPGLLGLTLLIPAFSPAQKTVPEKKAAPDRRQTCYQCHVQIKSLKEGTKHAFLACDTCHASMDEHLKSPLNKPATAIDQALCGKCHGDQYASANRVNYHAQARKEKGVPTGRSPMQEKLLEPHGFTKEHNEPRAHVFMVTDQFIVDRYAGGRFQYKRGSRGFRSDGKSLGRPLRHGPRTAGDGQGGKPHLHPVQDLGPCPDVEIHG